MQQWQKAAACEDSVDITDDENQIKELNSKIYHHLWYLLSHYCP